MVGGRRQGQNITNKKRKCHRPLKFRLNLMLSARIMLGLLIALVKIKIYSLKRPGEFYLSPRAQVGTGTHRKPDRRRERTTWINMACITSSPDMEMSENHLPSSHNEPLWSRQQPHELPRHYRGDFWCRAGARSPFFSYTNRETEYDIAMHLPYGRLHTLLGAEQGAHIFSWCLARACKRCN